MKENIILPALQLKGNMKIKISKLAKKDAQKAYKFCHSIFDELNWNKNYMYGLKNLNKTFGPSNETFVVVKNNKKIIACAGLKKLTKKTALLKRFYVAKTYRGKGLAQKILDKIINFAHKNDYSTIVLDTYHNNLQAKKFYFKNDFYQFTPAPNKNWPESDNTRLFTYLKKNLLTKNKQINRPNY